MRLSTYLTFDDRVIMSFEEEFWGGKLGMLLDRFGIQ